MTDGQVEIRLEPKMSQVLGVLAHLGLALKRSDISVTYNISEYGKQVIQSPKIQQRCKESFEKDLLPLRA